MARLRKKGSAWTVRLRYGEGQDSWFDLDVDAGATDVAEDRRRRLQRMANLLRAAGKVHQSRAILEDAAALRSERDFRKLEVMVEGFSPGEKPSGPQTFRQVAEYFASGAFQDEHPDDVKKRKDVQSLALSKTRLKAFYPELGSLTFPMIGKAEVKSAIKRIPKGNPNTRRAYLIELRRVLRIAAHPLELVEHAVEVTIPPKAPRQAFTFLYPENDYQLISSGRAPFARRFLYAYLDRTGRRIREVLLGTWDHVDLKAGQVRVEASWTKTRVAQFYALDEDVLEALRLRHASLKPMPTDRVFVSPTGRPMNRRSVLRWMVADLKAVELDKERPELLDPVKGAHALRVHDLGRGTFVTLARAMGQSDRWLMDRTGHESGSSLELYDRVTRDARERNLGWLAPMGVALGMRGAVSIGPVWAEGHCYGLGQLWAIQPDPTGNSRGKAVTDPVHRERFDTSITEEKRQNPGASGSVSTPSGPSGPPLTPGVGQSSGPVDPVALALAQVEANLATALELATQAGEWSTVRILAKELEARRLAREAQQSSGVTDIASARRKREEKP